MSKDTGAVIHLAAVVSGTAEADFDLGMRVNVDGTRAMLLKCDLSGLEFTGADLSKSNFLEASIEGSNFTRATLTGAVFNADTLLYVPVFEAVTTQRIADFHQLDLRVDKTWTWSRASLTLYLDVQNVYNRWYPEVYVYSADWRDRSQVIGLPIFPSLGMRIDY